MLMSTRCRGLLRIIQASLCAWNLLEEVHDVLNLLLIQSGSEGGHSLIAGLLATDEDLLVDTRWISIEVMNNVVQPWSAYSSHSIDLVAGDTRHR